MRHVLYALVPATAAYVWYFGWGICINIVVATIAAIASEAVMLRLRGRPLKPDLADGTAIVTAVLLAFALPPLAPWWLPVLGSAAAIVIARSGARCTANPPSPQPSSATETATNVK